MNPRFVMILLLVGCASTRPIPPASAPGPVAPEDGFRAGAPPALSGVRSFVAPVPQEASLANGARLLVIENHALPLVTVQIDISVGIDEEPLAKRGLTWLLTAGLMEGTTSKSAADVDIVSDRLAARIWTDDGYVSVHVHLDALKETLPESLALLSEVLLHPGFKPAAMEKLRSRLLTQLAWKKGSLRAMAGDDIAPLLWGADSPRGLPSGGTAETIKAITVGDVVALHRRWFVPNNVVVTVAGDTSLEEMRTLLDSAWRGWKPHRLPARLTHSLPSPSPRRILFTEAPRTSQSEVLIGWHGPARSDPDALPLIVANQILGGQFSSRLMQNIRETKGFSYGVWSGLDFSDSRTSTLTAGGSIQAAHTAEAIAEFEKELDRLRTGDFTAEEIARARESLVRSIPPLFETNGAVAAAIASRVELGLPVDYYSTYSERMQAVMTDDVLRAVRKYVTPESWPIIVVGPKELVLEPLRKLNYGTVDEVSAR